MGAAGQRRFREDSKSVYSINVLAIIVNFAWRVVGEKRQLIPEARSKDDID